MVQLPPIIKSNLAMKKEEKEGGKKEKGERGEEKGKK